MRRTHWRMDIVNMGSWINPLPLQLIPTNDLDSFASFGPGYTGLPLPPHPGSFGFVRRHHTHEGIDLYAPPETPVCAVESGVVVHCEAFTGPSAGSPWWMDTQAVFVEGSSGVVVYGEIVPSSNLVPGVKVAQGDLIGVVAQVLKIDKGRPMSMLHLELHRSGTRQAPAWEKERPASLLDPTSLLLECSASPSLLGE